MKTVLVLGAVMLAAPAVSAQQAANAPAQQQQQRRAPDPRDMGGGACSESVYNCKDTPNPLPAPSTVWMEEMTWMDVRDALAAGKTTAIIATGGMEPNGPWLVTGKHNYVNKANCEAIARKLGNAICTPLLPYTPEGSIEPPTSHMRSPGTISMREETFQAMLTDIAHSLKMHGFKNIFFIGDSGGNQGGQRAVAEKLTAQWGGNPVVAHIQEYYTYGVVSDHMAERGLRGTEDDNMHDDPVITHNMFYADPSSVRWAERVAANKATINGVSIADRVQTLERARQIVDFRASYTVEAMNKAIANKGTLPAPERTAERQRPQQAAGPQQGQGQVQRPAPDPRDMGGRNCAGNAYNCADTPNPLPTATTVWLEEMTWMDVRDALKAGKTTAIISTGGMEPNGPWLVTGKHNYVLKANCEAIARNLGNALCAPIVKWVPEGSIEPQSGHMRSPGTISLRQETYEAMLTDIAHSLKMHGFKNMLFIGDSGGNQSGQDKVAQALTAQWNSQARAIHIGEYYTAPPGTPNVLRDLGVTREGMPSDGLHDSPGITMNMMLADPSSVRWAERVKTDQAVINGVSIADLGKTLEYARKISEARAARTADLIRERSLK